MVIPHRLVINDKIYSMHFSVASITIVTDEIQLRMRIFGAFGRFDARIGNALIHVRPGLYLPEPLSNITRRSVDVMNTHGCLNKTLRMMYMHLIFHMPLTYPVILRLVRTKAAAKPAFIPPSIFSAKCYYFERKVMTIYSWLHNSGPHPFLCNCF